MVERRDRESACRGGGTVPTKYGRAQEGGDAISSWMFFDCNRNGQQMICDILQTLISHELRPEQRAAEIEKSMQGDPVKEFRDGFGKECQEMGQAKDVAMQAIKTGKGPDGRPVNVKEIQDNMPVFNAMADACASPNVNTDV
jgi:hypothetical protein